MRTDTLSRVLESRTSIVSPKAATINCPHGDQTPQSIPFVALVLAVHESHEVGIPVMTFSVGEQTCWPYNFQTIDE